MYVRARVLGGCSIVGGDGRINALRVCYGTTSCSVFQLRRFW